MLTWKQQLMTHMGGDWRWCYVVYKIGWNVVSRVSCKVAAVLSGSSEWCESGVVGGGATWQSRLYPPPSLQSTPPPPLPSLPPQVHSLCNRPPLARTSCKIFPPCTVLVKFNPTDVIFQKREYSCSNHDGPGEKENTC